MACFDQFTQAFKTEHRLADAHIGQNQQELVAAEAADHVEFAQVLAHQLADPGQHPWLRMDRVCLAEIAKAVDGNQGEDERRAISPRPANLVVEQQLDIALIEDLGQWVVRRQLLSIAGHPAVLSQIGQDQENTPQLAIGGKHRKGATLAPGLRARWRIPDPHGSLVDGLPGMQDLHFEALVIGQRLPVLVFPDCRCVAEQVAGAAIAQMH